jgi:hypothetical protein
MWGKRHYTIQEEIINIGDIGPIIKSSAEEIPAPSPLKSSNVAETITFSMEIEYFHYVV